MKRPVVLAGVKQHRPVQAIVYRRRIASELRNHSTFRESIRYAVVGAADNAADRLRAVAKGRGPADYFNLIGR